MSEHAHERARDEHEHEHERARLSKIDITAVIAIGMSAIVSVWSGWVELGHMCGYGIVRPLPGTPLDDWELDLSITLPLCVDALGLYAVYCWLSGKDVIQAARSLAMTTALSAIIIGIAGQASYHVLSALGITRAPLPIVVIVSALPVLALAIVTALAHLRARAITTEDDARALTNARSLANDQNARAPHEDARTNARAMTTDAHARAHEDEHEDEHEDAHEHDAHDAREHALDTITEEVTITRTSTRTRTRAMDDHERARMVDEVTRARTSTLIDEHGNPIPIADVWAKYRETTGLSVQRLRAIAREETQK